MLTKISWVLKHYQCVKIHLHLFLNNWRIGVDAIPNFRRHFESGSRVKLVKNLVSFL